LTKITAKPMVFPRDFSLPHLQAAAEQFAPSGRILDLRPYGSGNVHDTFLVTAGPPEEPRFILQRLNTRVFRRPELVMQNLRTCTKHLSRRLQQESLGRRWETPRLLPARDGRDYWIDGAGSFWRGLSFVEAARTLDTISDLGHAREVGYALGVFHHLLSDLPAEHLSDPLPGFHVTPEYLAHYDEVLGQHGAPPSPEVTYGLQFVAARRAWAGVLEEGRALGRLRLRPIHGDPKVNNVMVDTATGQAVALVDLDTIKPGLVHYDIGDCLRSGGNPLGEETGQWEAVHFDPELGRSLLQGYLAVARDSLSENDYAYIYDAIRLIAFELGLRFFTDYLAGDVYFKVKHREHNLVRALVQFRLTESIEAQEKALRALIRDLR
jgi:Ser/Thr protein kinase RdoA (MazF antagonist)